MHDESRTAIAKPGVPNRRLVGTVALLLCALWLPLLSCSGATLSIISPPPRLTQKVKQAEATTSIRKLQSYEVVLIIDKSHSMLTKDCPALHSTAAQDPLAELCQMPVSRWQWCQEQLLDMARQAQDELPEKFRVVIFSGDYTIYDNVDPPGVHMIFAENHPFGPTCATPALKDQLDSYLARRSVASTRLKPLLIAVITDGCPNDPAALKNEIALATKRMQDPNEIAITILQVGHDNRAAKILSDLQDCTRAQFDIVRCQSFDQLQKTGLVRALVGAIGTSEHAVSDDEIGM